MKKLLMNIMEMFEGVQLRAIMGQKVGQLGFLLA